MPGQTIKALRTLAEPIRELEWPSREKWDPRVKFTKGPTSDYLKEDNSKMASL